MGIYVIDFDNLPEEAFEGFREGVSDRLQAYLKCIKEDGMAKNEAAAWASISYDTVITARRSPLFCELEKACHKKARGGMTKSVYTEGVKGSLGHAALWYKVRCGWVEGKKVELTGKDGKALKARPEGRLLPPGPGAGLR